MVANANISDIFSNLFAGKRDDICLSVTPGVGLEMIKIDYASAEIKAYANRPISYNESLRELTNLEEFKVAVGQMFEELNINPKCNVTLNLPTVLFGSMDINLMLGDEAITGAATSEVEQSYVFKRHDPIVKWMDSNTGTSENRKIFYSAVQQLVVDNVTQALAELGAQLVSVEMSLLSTLRALDFTGLAQEEMQEGVSWNLLIVNGTGYTIVSMSGKNVVDYYEEPIPVNSYEGDEIYNAISASAQISLMSLPANYLMVVSDTNAVSAEVLAKNYLSGEYTIEYVENNKFKRKDFMAASLDILPDKVAAVSLQAIGCGIARYSPYPLRCDFLAASNVEIKPVEETVTLPIGEEGITVTPTQAAIVAGLIAVVVLAITAIVAFGIFPKQEETLQNELDALAEENRKIEKQISELQTKMNATPVFNVKEAISDTIKLNRSKLIAYSAIGESVPDNLWLTKFDLNDRAQITVEGGAGSVEEVYLFYRNLREATGTNGMRLEKLQMNAVGGDEFASNVSYDFTVSNVTAKPAAPVVVQEEPADAKGKKGKKSRKKK